MFQLFFYFASMNITHGKQSFATVRVHQFQVLESWSCLAFYWIAIFYHHFDVFVVGESLQQISKPIDIVQSFDFVEARI